jgi:hypothetical protein
VISQDGSIERVESDEVTSHPVTHNQNVVPYSVSQRIVISMKWYNSGWENIRIQRQDDYELASTEDGSNSQPYLIKTSDGDLKYMYAMEPYGENTKGIYKIFVMDAQTMETEVIKFNGSGTLAGPGRAATYVEQLQPAWFQSEGGYIMSEPLPIKWNNELFWMYRVSKRSGQGGIAGIAFVSAEDPENKAIMYKSNTKAATFLTGSYPKPSAGSLRDVTPKEMNETQKDTTAVSEGDTIMIMKDTDDDGVPDKVVRNITIGDDEYIVVDASGNETNK